MAHETSRICVCADFMFAVFQPGAEHFLAIGKRKHTLNVIAGVCRS